MVKDLEELYERTMKNRQDEESKAPDEPKKGSDKKESKEEKGKPSDKKNDHMNIIQQMPRIDQSEFMSNF
jgi:hypothetical protein